MRRSHLLTTAVALVTGSCSLVPAYHRPETQVPAAWSGANQGAAPVDASFWHRFGSAELDGLIKGSTGGNLDLAAAVARVEQARAQAQIAGAPLYPSLGIAGNLDVGGGGSTSSRVSSLVGQASYELDFWGKNRATASSATALVEARAFEAQTVAVTLQASVADTYFEILALQARLNLARQLTDGARHVLSLVEAQAAGGIASDLEVQQQRNALAVFEAAVPALEQQLEQTRHGLAVLLGETPEMLRLSGGALLDVAIPRAQADLPSVVLARRPDVRAAEARLVSANFDIGAARAAFLPSVTLSVQAGVTSFVPPVAVWDLVAGLLQPIFQGGRLDGQLRFSRAVYVELAASYRQTVIVALRDVEDALTAVDRLEELERLEQVAVESARRASMLARAQFDAGTADFLNVLTTERTLYQAEDTVLQVRLQRLEASVALFRALGGAFGTKGRTS